ncbi:MAG: TULIP family P47-like protein [Gammaproteobacteria bacterium]|nr:TULIP family P47-like protein [Gammaproteobacteria bacterium]
MELYNWDAVSIASVQRINEALRNNADELLLTFEYADAQAVICGEFGSWQIAAGTAGSLVYLDLPIDSGTLQPPTSQAQNQNGTDVAGVIVRVEVPLRIMPPPAQGGDRTLCFDLRSGEGDDSDAGVRFVHTEDPENRLDELSQAVLGNAVARCLTANGAKVSYVFAKLGVAATNYSWLTLPYYHWCQIQTVKGPGYLAVLGSATADEKERVVDSRALTGDPAAVFMVSQTLFMSGAVLPHMNNSFVKGSRFHAHGDHLRLAKPINLPTRNFSFLYTARPVIDKMDLYISGSNMVVVTDGHMGLPLGAQLTFTVTTKLPFTYDPGKRGVAFKPDKNPDVKTHVKLLPGLDTIVGWFVRWIVSFFNEGINGTVRSIASALQGMSSPPPAAVSWTGLREFLLTDAKLDGCLVFIDGSAN